MLERDFPGEAGPAERHNIWDFPREFSPPTTSIVLNPVGTVAVNLRVLKLDQGSFRFGHQKGLEISKSSPERYLRRRKKRVQFRRGLVPGRAGRSELLIATERSHVNRCDLVRSLIAHFPAPSCGEVLCKLIDHLVIHQMQSLWSDERLATENTVGPHLRIVKVLQQRWHLRVALQHADTASPTLL